MSSATPTIWLAGASGLVGRALLEELPAGSVHALLRKPLEQAPPSVSQHVLDLRSARFAAALPAPDAVVIALGTTIAQAGSQEAFRAVDFELVLQIAQAARQAGARACAVVSSLGADADSRAFYTRVKGEAEAALIALAFEHLVIARPSLLDGNRAALQQPRRLGEHLALALMRPLAPLIPARWRPIQAQRVARAMARALASTAQGVQILESADLQRTGAG